MRIVVLFFAAFLGIVLRDTVFNGLSVAGGKPDFVLILVVFFAIFRGSVQGGLMGAALGMMEDLMTGRFIGINALCKGLLGYLAGVSERNLYKNNFFFNCSNSGGYFPECLAVFFVQRVDWQQRRTGKTIVIVHTGCNL